MKNKMPKSIKNFEVGNTPLLKFEPANLGLETKLTTILVKDESTNPYYTFKDRKAKEVAIRAYQREADYVMAITSGNYGYVLSSLLEQIGVNTLLFVPDNTNKKIVNHLRQKAAVIPLDLEKMILDYGRMMQLAEQMPKFRGKKSLDATNFFDEAYFPIFIEIERELEKQNKNLDYIIVPLGSGELFAAALRYYIISDTKVIGVTTNFKNTIATMLYAKHRPIMEHIKRHLKPDEYSVLYANEDEILQAYKTLKGKINSEPSAAAAFTALQNYNFKPSDTVVVVNTGNGLKNFT